MTRTDHSLLGRARAAGILLHPTSLPGKFGIGTLGPEAEQFLDFMAAAGQSLWQVLPVGPTGYGDSPYQGFSAFAGNTLLIAVEPLLAAGWLSDADLPGESGDPPAAADKVDFREIIQWKSRALRAAFSGFRGNSRPVEKRALQRFRAESNGWIEDYALFMALKESHGGVAWLDWSPEYRDRDPRALEEFAVEHSESIEYHVFAQWLFHRQWSDLRAGARARGISIIGDIPIFVSLDSADVWAKRELFRLDERGRPVVVAGVPPDYYTETGQLWGNPVYEWSAHEKTGFSWWRDVLSGRFALFDFVRVDHFRGFCAYWAVPNGQTTAEHGEWVPAPGRTLFRSLEEDLGVLRIVAEDLGVITPDVVELMDEFGFPGMKILQFGFDTREGSGHLPHTYSRNSVVYTGGHDNDTVLGWLASAPVIDREFALRYLVSDGAEPHWDFIRAALASTSQFAITPMQDLLGLGSEARMNKPGTLGGNWTWKMTGDEALHPLAARLRDLTELYRRLP